MPWRGPEYEGEFPTIGWELLAWWAHYLPSPRDEGSPLIFTREQATILLRWYQIDPASGEFVYRRGCSRRSKGWGKSPVEAAKVIAELAGPVRFDGWDADGNPVGRPWGTKGDPDPWVQVAAVSEDQTDNTYSVVNYFLSANDGRAAGELRVDHGITRCYLRDRPGRLEPVTAAAGSREGQPVTYGQLDETHLWTTRNGGVRLARTIRRNVAKMNGRSYETTNSYEPAMGSVAEDTHKAANRGFAGIFYDAVEAPPVKPEDTDDELAEALAVAYGDAWWVDLERIVREIRDPDTPWEDAERFFFNHSVAGQGRAVDPKRWEALIRRDGRPEPGTRIGLGFDGSISDDATILRGCTAEGYSFALGEWIRDPADRDWRVPRREVHEAVADAFSTYRVGRMLCDPAKWWTEIETWAARWGDEVVLFFDTNQDRRMAPAVDRWMTALREGTHTNDGNPTVVAHVAAAHRRKAKATAPDDDSRTLYTIVKGEDGSKIDAAVADILAFEAAMTMPVKRKPLLVT